MSVLPLTVAQPNPTVVERREDFQPYGDTLLIMGLDRRQLLAEANASYDLRVGPEFRDHREEGKRELSENGIITLRPGAALIIQTEETIHLPAGMYGIIAPKVSLLQKGVSNTFSKVDPGYGGRLLISLFNLGKSTILLRRGEPFCALTVLRVTPPARLYNKPEKRISGGSVLTRIQTLSDWLEARSGYVHLALVIVTFFLVIATSLDLLTRFFVHNGPTR